ncbi:MAG: tRNA (adenosine(37)-N6)-dimethylallyltransferase MiaA [Treponema sp.]|nr:tRNA (adenosine(37)-N6)-dimethylallyltransferase MiaA [Treponema sp.]
MDYNCVVVLGPTAVGKTSIGVQIAHKFDGEIISADSRQTYKGLDIGSGKDLCEYCVDGKNIPYHLIDITDLSMEYNVFHYQQDFYKVFTDLLNRNVLPVIVGGTGMYLDAVVRNYDFVLVPENVELRKELEEKSLEELDEMLLSLKPDLHNKSDLLERDRVIRAIEIATCMNSPEADVIRSKMIARPDIRPLIIGTTFDRNLVRQNIEIRLKERLDNGLVEEVEGLHNSGFSWERLEKLGLEYRFCSLFLQGKIKSKDELFEKLNIAIRQFAKRQETWFRGMEAKGVEINWLPAVQDKNVRISAALSLVEKHFKQ